MPFVTKLTLRSGDRAALKGVVDEIRGVAERKGIEIKGPHAAPPETFSVPLYRRLTGNGGRFDPWEYTVYERRFEIVGHEEIARQLAGRDMPSGVSMEVTVDRMRSAGSG